VLFKKTLRGFVFDYQRKFCLSRGLDESQLSSNSFSAGGFPSEAHKFESKNKALIIDFQQKGEKI